jgi:hypothetical protein
MISNETAAKIMFAMVESGSFDNWYRGEFTRYIEGDLQARGEKRATMKEEMMNYLLDDIKFRAKRINAKKRKMKELLSK